MTDYNTRGGIGDNSMIAGPIDLNERARIDIDDALRSLIPAIEKRLDSCTRAIADSVETAGMVTDLAVMLANSVNAVDRAHATAKAPYLEAGRVVDGIAGGWREKLTAGRDGLMAILTAYQNAEADRVRAIRAAERAAEAADPEPTAATVTHKAVDAVKIVTRGDLGARATLTEVLQIDSVDVKKLPKAFLERAKIIAVIEAEAKVVLKAGGKVNGVTSSMGTKSTARRGG